MLNLTCPAATGTQSEPGRCKADSTVLDVHIATGEITAWCADHADMAGGPGYVVVHTAGPLHSTSLYTR